MGVATSRRIVRIAVPALGCVGLVAAASPPALAQDAAALPPLVATFTSVCVPASGDIEATRALLGDAGWVTATGEEATELPGLMAALDVAGLDVQGQGGTYEDETYAHPGQPYFVTLSVVSREGMSLLSCQVYDLDATEAISQELLSDWLGADPNGELDQPGLVTAQIWDFAPEFPMQSLSHMFIPVGSRQNADTGFTGEMLSLSRFMQTPAE